MKTLYTILYGLMLIIFSLPASLFAQSKSTYLIDRTAVPVQKYELQLGQELPGTNLRSNDCNCISEASGEVLLCDNFQQYEQGPISTQSPNWSLWPGASRDAYVDGSSSGNQFLRLRHEDGAESDVVLNLGNRTEGKYKLSFRLWTWSGYSGYYNIQHDNQLNPPNWAYHVQFINGKGHVRVGSFTQPIAIDSFDYQPNAWNDVEQIIDLDEDEITLVINQEEVGRWPFSLGSRGPEKRLGAIDFFANAAFNAQFVVDNICLEGLEAEEPTPELSNLFCASRGEMTVDRTNLTLSLRGVSVRNTGPGTSPATRLGYYFSTNLNFTDKDFLIATADIPALAPGETVTFNLFIRLREAPVPNDTYYFGFLIDHENRVEETNEADNNDCYWTSPRFIYRIIPPSQPNLNCGYRGDLSRNGDLLSINDARVENNTDIGAAASKVGIYLSRDENITTADYRIGLLDIDSLPPASQQEFNFSQDLSQLTDLPEGNYFLGILIDPLEQIEESEEQDNRCYWPSNPIYIRKEPLIANLNCFYPGELTVADQSLTIENMIIENNGGTPSGDFQVGVYLSENKNITSNDFLIHEFSLSSIPGSDAVTLSPMVDLSNQNVPPGDYYLGTIIDYKNRVEELSEADNRGCSFVGIEDQLITVSTPPSEACACTDPFADPICEDFDSYQPGLANAQSNCFDSNGNGNIREGVITAAQSFSGTQSLGIRENGQADALFLLGEKSIGLYELAWVMYIPFGKTSYITLQEKHQVDITKLQLSFGGDGQGQIIEYGTPFNYPENRWFRVRMMVDMDLNHVSVYIDDRLVDKEIPFFFSLGSLQFTTLDGRSTYFIDDVNYELLFTAQPGRASVQPAFQIRPEKRLLFSAYPNPAKDWLQVDLSAIRTDIRQLRLMNQLGQTVWSQTFVATAPSHLELSLEGLKAGVYMLIADTQGGREVIKVVKP